MNKAAIVRDGAGSAPVLACDGLAKHFREGAGGGEGAR